MLPLEYREEIRIPLAHVAPSLYANIARERKMAVLHPCKLNAAHHCPAWTNVCKLLCERSGV